MATDIQKRNHHSGLWILGVLSGVAMVLIGALCAWRLTVGIVRPMRGAVELAQKVASGDLSTHAAAPRATKPVSC
jgi:methyl-accepting chemotaxis protein